MAQFFTSRARKLFQYVDLQGTTIPSNTSNGAEGHVTTSMNDGSAMIHLENGSNSPGGRFSGLRQRRRSLLILVGVMFIAIVTIVALTYHDNASKVIASAISAFVSTPSPGSSNTRTGYSVPFDSDRQVSLRDINYNSFYPNNFNGSWLNDHEIIYLDSEGGVSLQNAFDGTVAQIISSEQVIQLNVVSFTMSADMKYLLIKRTHRPLFRHSSFGKYSILKLENGRHSTTMTDLKPNTVQGHDFEITFVKWAPVGNSLVYVDTENNIYYRRTALAQDDKLTENGKATVIYNGVPDWVFEEEVLEGDSAIWWSPDGLKLVWGHFDDTEVVPMLLPEYGDYRKLIQYPDFMQIRYPKVGTSNPKVELYLADMSNNEIEKKLILPPASMANEEVHFSWVTWANEDKFAVSWMNRVQDKTVTSLCSVSDLDCSRLVNEIFNHEQPGGWVDYKYRIKFNPMPQPKENLDFVTILPAPHLKHGFRQLAHVSNGTTTFLTDITAGEVTEIVHWSSEGFIYYVATLDGNPGSRFFYRILSPTESKSRNIPAMPECLSCANNTKEMEFLRREECLYAEVKMSLNGSFYTLDCSGPGLPWSAMFQTAEPKFLRAIETNADLEKHLAQYDLPQIQNLEVPVPGTDQKARVKLYLPPHFNSQQKYPLVVYIYGGPSSQMVDEKWNQHDYETYLSGSEGVIYAVVDPMGSGFQGSDWLYAVHKNFGGPEVTTTTEVAKFLKSNLSYVDESKIAVWGWSYGGFLSLSVIAHDTDDVFKCGAAVAPVVDWRLYDTYYTERYMGLLPDEVKAYNQSSILNYLESFRKKKLFILHGTQDDNVHFQQSMFLSAALEEKDILFRQQVYPDQDHSIGRYHQHLYSSLTDFFLNDCFSRP